MKTFFSTLLILAIAHLSSFANTPTVNWTEDFEIGNPQIASVNALAFGPEGILFIGDSRQAAIIAIDTKDHSDAPAPESIDLKKIDQQIAALVGTTADDITIQDIAVNPISKKIYIAVHRQDGQPILVTTDGMKFDHFPLESVSFSKTILQKAVGPDAKDQRGRSLRQWSISDLAFQSDRVMVSGLANEEFSSAFHAIPFPFKDKQQVATLEIYHASHGRYETYAPIKTFMPYQIDGKDYLIASYTCTPLVLFPMDEVQPGKHIKGKTVAELGNRNTPLDIISYEKDGKSFLLLANTSRALMRIDPEKISQFEDYLTEPVPDDEGTAGVHFIALPYVNIQQLDKLSDSQVLVLQRMSNGDLDLHTLDTRRL
ncbi:MAG: hypothetical protein R2824_16215 [Saprospiraceae bacterium]|nr:hypothetical protein [Lewinella sp.]